MIRAALALRIATVSMFAARDVGFHADDRLDARALHLIVKRDRAVHIAVIGDGNGTRSEFLRALGERLDLNGPVEKTEVGM